MIIATGIDLIEIDRIRGLIVREPRFIERCFTAEEQAELAGRQDPAPGYAARFAAKEAFQKAWPESFSWTDVWVTKNGRVPVLAFAPHIAEVMQERGYVAHVSLSHSQTHAIATVILEDRS